MQVINFHCCELRAWQYIFFVKHTNDLMAIHAVVYCYSFIFLIAGHRCIHSTEASNRGISHSDK